MTESFTVRDAKKSDLSQMVTLSSEKRLAYEKAEPQFWKRSVNADELQLEWFNKILEDKNHILLVGLIKNKIEGFIIGNLILAPSVYNPGGLTLMIDDFCVRTSLLWNSLGRDLLKEIKNRGKNNQAVQVLVVAGHHDKEKIDFLKKVKLSVVSEWYIGNIDGA